jgi:hypothetical protein
MFQTKVVEKIEANILYSKLPPPPPPENRAVYKIMWNTMAQLDALQMKTIWSRKDAICIPGN